MIFKIKLTNIFSIFWAYAILAFFCGGGGGTGSIPFYCKCFTINQIYSSRKGQVEMYFVEINIMNPVLNPEYSFTYLQSAFSFSSCEGLLKSYSPIYAPLRGFCSGNEMWECLDKALITPIRNHFHSRLSLISQNSSSQEPCRTRSVKGIKLKRIGQIKKIQLRAVQSGAIINASNHEHRNELKISSWKVKIGK